MAIKHWDDRRNRTEYMGFRLTKAMKKLLVQQAEKHDMSMSNYIQMLVIREASQEWKANV